MTPLFDLSVLVSAAGLVVLVAGVFMGHGRSVLSTALDFWLAAGLLNLSSADDWPSIATAGTIAVLRHVAAKEVERDPPGRPRKRASMWQALRRAPA